MMDTVKRYDNLPEFIDVAVFEVEQAFSLNEECSERFREVFTDVVVNDILFHRSNYSVDGEDVYSVRGNPKFVSLNILTAFNRANLSPIMHSDASIDLVTIPMNADTIAQALVLKSKSMIQEESKKFIR